MSSDGATRAPGSLALLRHGESTTNAAGQFTGWTDVPLTVAGRSQAIEAGRRLAAAGLAPDEVHTFLLSRAISPPIWSSQHSTSTAAVGRAVARLG